MSTEKHTPGPWLIEGSFVYSDREETGHDDPETVRGYGGHLIAESISPRNRQIIAAAPLLLEACKAALEEDCGLMCAQQLREAITAAGEDPEH